MRSNLFFFFFLSGIHSLCSEKPCLTPNHKVTFIFGPQVCMVLMFTSRAMLHPKVILFYENVIRFETKSSYNNFCFHLDTYILYITYIYNIIYISGSCSLV